MRNLRRFLRRLLLKFVYRKLWVRIALVLFAVVTLPVVLQGTLLINTSQQAVRDSVLTNYKQIALRTAAEIGLFVKGSQDLLTGMAAMLGVVYPAPWKEETMLVELVLNHPVFIRAAAVDLNGALIATSELGSLAPPEYPAEALKKAAQGESFMSGVKFLDNHTPFVTMGVPIKKLGRVSAVLIADVNLRGVWDIADNIRIGKTGRVFLVSGDGTVIAHQDKKLVLRNENLKGQKEVRFVLSGKAEAIETSNPGEGRFISAYAPIPSLGWGLVLRQAQREAYLFSKVMKTESWIIILFSELVVIAVSIFMARALARPVRALASSIRRVADGDLDHTIHPGMRDTIGELARSFNEMTKKLKAAKVRERFSAIGEAVAWITHELKNSLISIKAFVQLFPQRHNDEAFVRKFNRLIPEEINRMEYLFRDLSDLSGNTELKASDTDVREVMEGVLEIMREEFAQKKVNVTYSPPRGEFRIQADAARLRQVFMNLVINAINAMPSGGTLAVSIARVTHEGCPGGGGPVEVKIKDTGRGMSKEALDNLFEPFSNNAKNTGMGLGLSISRKIVQQHGGKITVESSPGNGTQFTLIFPEKISLHPLS